MVREYLKEIGYTNYDIEKILTTYPICNLKEETLLKNIKKNYEYFIVIGYTQEEVLKMTKSHPPIYSYFEDLTDKHSGQEEKCNKCNRNKYQ